MQTKKLSKIKYVCTLCEEQRQFVVDRPREILYTFNNMGQYVRKTVLFGKTCEISPEFPLAMYTGETISGRRFL